MTTIIKNDHYQIPIYPEYVNNSNLEIISERDEQGLVNEVFKRVTKRIISERLK